MTKIEIPSKFSKYNEVLQSIKKSGVMPTLSMFYRQLGVTHNDFKSNLYANKTWALNIKKEYDKIRKDWEDYGGNAAKAAKKALKSIQEKGEEPTFSEVCIIANTSRKQLSMQTFPWTKKLYNEIINANKLYLEGIYNAKYEICIETLNEMIKEGEFPTPGTVSKNSGEHKDLLRKNIFPWKEKIIKAIENTRRDYIKLDPFYQDIDILIDKIVSKKPLYYSRMGIYFKDIDEKYTLSHIMYADHLIGRVGGGKEVEIYVKKESFTKKRSRLVEGIIMSCEGVSQKTSGHRSIFQYIIKSAIWVGDRPSNSINDGKSLFVDFSQPLRIMVKSGEITNMEGFRRQKSLLKLLSGMFSCDKEEFSKDNKGLLISQTAPSTNAYFNAARFSQQELEYAFTFYYHLFKQTAEIILENKPLPHPIKLPAGQALVFGLGNTLFVTSETKQASRVIDYNDGHILTTKEISALSIQLSKLGKSPISSIKSGLLKQREAHIKELCIINSDPTHPKRLQLGKKALDAWFMCMLFFTAMNDSTLGTLEWGEDDELELEINDRKEFYNIKPRAQYKGVRFALPKGCIEDFKEFLSLRRFVLNGQPFHLKAMEKMPFITNQ